MTTHAKYFKDSKCINLWVYDKELLQKCNEIWNKIINLLKKTFDSKPVYNYEYIKTKISL